MVQIVQKPPTFGESFGTGLGAGLQQLLSSKLQQLTERNQQEKAAKLYEMGGLSPEISRAISAQPEAIQKALLDRLEGLQFGGLQQPSPEANIFQQLTGSQPENVAQPGLQSQQPSQGQQLGGIRLGPGSQERRHRELLDLKKQALEQKQQAEAFKLTKQERSEILKKGRKAEQELEDLTRFQELEKEGKLDTPGYVEFLKRSGLDIPALLNVGSEEFNKIAANFIGGAKDALGGRVTNFELEQFLKTIPSLSQSPEGRKRVIANLKRIKRTEVEYRNALKDVMKENKGVPPLDLLERVDDRLSTKLDKISKQFKEDLSKEVPEGQNKFITALQTTLGTIAGRLPKAAGGAGLGAYAGSRYGLPGAVGGGILGGLAGLGGLSIKDLLPIG